MERETNRALNEEEMSGGRVLLSSRPRRMIVTLTTRCPTRCVMCYQRGQPVWDLPAGAHREILRGMPYLQSVVWQGGEPLLYPGFAELFHAAARCGVRQSLFTSGQAIPDDWIGLLVRHRVAVILSVDGATPEVYERIRRGASFDNLLSFASRFARAQREAGEHGLLHLSVVVMRSNLREIDRLPAFARCYGAATVSFNRLCALSGSDLAREEDILSASADPHEATLALEGLRLAEQRLSRAGIRVASMLCPGQRRPPEQPPPAPRPLCTVPWQWLFVDAQGLVKPHCACRVSLGRVADSSLAELWNGVRAKEYRRRALDHAVAGFCSPACLAGLTPVEIRAAR